MLIFILARIFFSKLALNYENEVDTYILNSMQVLVFNAIQNLFEIGLNVILYFLKKPSFRHFGPCCHK